VVAAAGEDDVVLVAHDRRAKPALVDAPRTRAEAEQLVRMAADWTQPAARIRALDVAVRTCLARSPADRYPSGAALAAALESIPG